MIFKILMKIKMINKRYYDSCNIKGILLMTIKYNTTINRIEI